MTQQYLKKKVYDLDVRTINGLSGDVIIKGATQNSKGELEVGGGLVGGENNHVEKEVSTVNKGTKLTSVIDNTPDEFKVELETRNISADTMSRRVQISADTEEPKIMLGVDVPYKGEMISTFFKIENKYMEINTTDIQMNAYNVYLGSGDMHSFLRVQGDLLVTNMLQVGETSLTGDELEALKALIPH